MYLHRLTIGQGMIQILLLMSSAGAVKAIQESLLVLIHILGTLLTCRSETLQDWDHAVNYIMQKHFAQVRTNFKSIYHM